ncbi:Signal recognition particle receptor FtsY [Candidatus Arsenophonus lipoptenae]|uniref:Signal recognition particle receptor FtsY n=1 Tax=Candidatus Arsenophonus lipoptenae TaxID=634113 RepID=A0A0X9VJ26_9GAMM|nr:Signal recognition particle receptor FtsY [Candidatus Arsenophonus lipoptenae]
MKENFLTYLRNKLLKTRQNIGVNLINFFKNKKIDYDFFDQLEEQLLIADLGIETTRKIINNLISYTSSKKISDTSLLYSILREEMKKILFTVDKPVMIKDTILYIILMVGVNGSGKTTTIGKLARQYQEKGKSVMLVAGDTFRAAAIEQLQFWGEYNNIPVISRHTGADPASIIFDSIQLAKIKKINILIIDTAGRLHNKLYLMEELKKIIKVIKKIDQEAPHEVLLTVDSSTGQNVINQVKIFHDMVSLTGIIVTKLDGTAKGGVIFSIVDKFKIPIRYIGIGNGVYDLRKFVAHDFIEAIFVRDKKINDFF